MKQKGFEITGTKDVQKVLDQIAPRHARNLMRATIHGVAGEIAKDAKKHAPKDTGNLKKQIKAKRKKSPPDSPVAEVRIVQGKQKRSAFYWKFIEFGTKLLPAHPFIGPAADRARQNFNKILTEQFGKKLEKALAREAKKLAKKKQGNQ